MPEYDILKVDGKKMSTTLRFFDNATSMYALFQIDNAKANQIPHIGATIQLDDVIRNPDYDYDYGIVVDTTYSYDEDGVLIDVMLRSGYWSEDEDEDCKCLCPMCTCEECYSDVLDDEDEEEDE